MIDHVIKGNGESGLKPCHDIRGGITDEDHIYPCLIEDLRHRIIIGCEHRDLFTLQLHLIKHVSGNQFDGLLC